MTLSEATQLYESFQVSNCQALVKWTLKYAIRYTNLRVDWWLHDTQGRIEMDAERTRAHNAFISSCDALARNMKINNESTDWHKKLGHDRKAHPRTLSQPQHYLLRFRQRHERSQYF